MPQIKIIKIINYEAYDSAVEDGYDRFCKERLEFERLNKKFGEKQ